MLLSENVARGTVSSLAQSALRKLCNSTDFELFLFSTSASSSIEGYSCLSPLTSTAIYAQHFIRATYSRWGAYLAQNTAKREELNKKKEGERRVK